MKDDSTAVVGCSAIVLAIVMVPVNMALNGIVLAQLFNWFAAPFFGLPEMSLLTAFGLSLIAGYLLASAVTGLARETSKTKSWTEIFVEILVFPIIKVSFWLFTGWIVHSLMISPK